MCYLNVGKTLCIYSTEKWVSRRAFKKFSSLRIMIIQLALLRPRLSLAERPLGVRTVYTRQVGFVSCIYYIFTLFHLPFRGMILLANNVFGYVGVVDIFTGPCRRPFLLISSCNLIVLNRHPRAVLTHYDPGNHVVSLKLRLEEMPDYIEIYSGHIF